MKLRLLSFGLCLATGATVAAVSAQVAKKPAPKVPAVPTATQADNVRLHADNYIYDDNSGIVRLTGNVTVAQAGEALILYAQQLVYNRPKMQGVSTSGVRIDTRSSTVRGDHIFADFNTKIATISGNVVITTHGKRDGINGNRQDLRAQYSAKPSKIFCDKVEWDYDEHQATLSGHIRMTQGENSGTCEQILYDEDKNVAQLINGVRFTDNKNRTFNTSNLMVYIDEGRIVTNVPGSLTMPRLGATGTAPAATKSPRMNVPPAPKISDEEAKLFGITPPPIPTPRPEPTEAPVAPPPAEPDEPAPDAPPARR